MAPVTLAGLADGIVPKPVATSILKRVQENSVVAQLAGSIPIPLEGASIAVQTGHIEAGVVGEGQLKPVGGTTYGAKTIKPIKVAAIAIASKELRMKNPAGVLDNLQQDLGDAVTRAFDLAILHGRDAKTGAQIPGVEFVNGTSKRVYLGTATQAQGGIGKDILNGYDLVVNGDQVQDDFTGFAFDRKMRSQLMGATDTTGKSLFGPMDLGGKLTSFAGLPVGFARAVSGKIGASADTGVVGIGGDYGALKYGWSETMTLSISDQATIVDGGTTYYLWQQNLEAYLVEAIFGWVISDVDSFVAYEGGTAPGAVATITAAAPSAAVTGDVVTLTGTGFTGATKVKFGATNATSFDVDSDTSMTAVMPDGTAGTANIKVTNAKGDSAAFTYTRG